MTLRITRSPRNARTYEIVRTDHFSPESDETQQQQPIRGEETPPSPRTSTTFVAPSSPTVAVVKNGLAPGQRIFRSVALPLSALRSAVSPQQSNNDVQVKDSQSILPLVCIPHYISFISETYSE